MRDPHVEWVSYRLVTPEHIEYRAPPPLEVEAPAFKLSLSNGTLRCEMLVHCQSIVEARGLVEPFLRAWEIDADLRIGRRELKFVLDDWAVIDRNPSRGTLPALQVRAAGVVGEGFAPSIRITRSAYPEPPSAFHVSPNVETLWRRYEQHLDGKEPLLSMGYFCLTVLQGWAGSRQQASDLLRLDRRVLQRLGELTSGRGDDLSARKMPRSGELQPLGAGEVEWVRRVIKFLIRRLAEHDADVEMDRITLEHFDDVQRER